MKIKHLKLGATGRFPEGKVDETDEGELRLALTADVRQGVVRLAFGKPVAWFALPADRARALARFLIAKADEVDRGKM